MKFTNDKSQGLICPIPLTHHNQIVIGHGSGGKLTQDLISRTFTPLFENPILNKGNDAGVITLDFDQSNTKNRLAISTDSHVVSPLFFPGGDIGRLAICGTVNDVSMMGAKPLYITAGFILEEGLEIDVLSQIVKSMNIAAQEAAVTIIAGDTKVVQKGKADGLFINTTGVGILFSNSIVSGDYAQPGDAVILSGSIGDHGIAVLEAREELGITSNVVSDVAPLNHLVEQIMGYGLDVHVLRDPTRGGLATTLNEIARQSKICIEIDEDSIPIKPTVRSACELFGYDPLYMANEGKLVAIIDNKSAQSALLSMRNSEYGEGAVIIGYVREEPSNRVLVKTTLGTTRVVSTLSGELLPRIC